MSSTESAPNPVTPGAARRRSPRSTATSAPGSLPAATPSPPSKHPDRAPPAAPGARGAFQSPTLRPRRGALAPAAATPRVAAAAAGDDNILVTPPAAGRRVKRARAGGPSPPSAAVAAAAASPLDDADAALDDAVLGRRARLSRVDAALAALVGRPSRAVPPPAPRAAAGVVVDFGAMVAAGAAARAARQAGV